MKNGNLSQFLDTGWYTEAVLYYDGYVYWCEGVTDFDTGVFTSFVNSWRAECDGELYHQYVNNAGELIDYRRVFTLSGKDFDYIKGEFFKAPIFSGKSFWQVEKDLVWVEEGSDIMIQEENRDGR